MPSITREITINWGGAPGEIRYAVPTGYDAVALQVRLQVTDRIGGNPFDKPESERDPAACEAWILKRNETRLEIARKAVRALCGEWEGIDTAAPGWIDKWVTDFEQYALGLGEWVGNLICEPAFEANMLRTLKLMEDIKRRMGGALPDELKHLEPKAETEGANSADPTISATCGQT